MIQHNGYRCRRIDNHFAHYYSFINTQHRANNKPYIILFVNKLILSMVVLSLIQLLLFKRSCCEQAKNYAFKLKINKTLVYVYIVNDVIKCKVANGRC